MLLPHQASLPSPPSATVPHVTAGTISADGAEPRAVDPLPILGSSVQHCLHSERGSGLGPLADCPKPNKIETAIRLLV